MEIRKAQRMKAKLRLGIAAPSGGGKTYSALLLAFGLGGKVGLIDTENGSGDLYAHLGDYYVAPLAAPYTVAKYRDAIRSLEAAGCSTIIIDSLSHAWAGEGGLLDKQGAISTQAGFNSYTAWRKVTPEHNALVEAMLQSPCHIIATMRSKQEYVLETDSRGKQVPKKVGMAPVQREGMEYEFTVFLDIDIEHVAHSSKDRTGLFDGLFFKVEPKTGKILLDWLEKGVEAPNPKPEETEPKPDTQDTPKSEYKPLTIAGLLKTVKKAGTNGSTRYGLAIDGDKRVFGTYSAPEATRAEGFIGKKITITYNETSKNGKPVFEMIGFEPVEA